MSDLYSEKLAYFRENERPEAVLLIAEEPYSMRIAVAWTNTAATRAEGLSPLNGDAESQVWSWLWRNTAYSREEVISKSGVPEHEFGSRMASLVGNRILYPDGTINSFVQRYLRDRVMKLFGAAPKKRVTKS